jgi:hypothetical protein
MQTAMKSHIQWLYDNQLELNIPIEVIEDAEDKLEMEKQQIIDAYDAGLFDGTMDDVNDRMHKQYYNETYGSKGSDKTKTIEKESYPEFPDRIWLYGDGRKLTPSQTEISDEEIKEKIEKALNNFKQEHTVLNLYPSNILQNIAEFGAKWYREQLRNKK